MSQINLISCVKDEGPFILEWVAHHLSVGFDRICIAYNDCTDGTAELLQALDRHGFIESYENIIDPQKGGKQRQAYDKLIHESIVQDADWLAILDCDEFLNVEIGDHSVQYLTDAHPDVDFILLNARQFGPGDQEKWTPGLVTEQFQTHLPPTHTRSGMAKWLARAPRRAKQLGNHAISFSDSEYPVKFINGNGERHSYPIDDELAIDKFFKSVRKLGVAGHRDFSFHHYASKTIDSWALKNLRGRGVNGPMRHSEANFMSYLENATEINLSIAQYAAQTKARLEEMLAIDEIMQLHENCMINYQRRIDWVWEKFDNEGYSSADFFELGKETGGDTTP